MMNSSTMDEELRTGVLIHIFICAVLGLLINIPIIFILSKKLTKNCHVDMQLCAIVSITDIIVCFCSLFRAVFTKFPYNLIEIHHSWCTFDILTGSQFNLISGYFLAVMSIERFLLICFNIKLSIYIWYFILASAALPQYIIATVAAYNGLAIIVKIKVYCTFVPKGAGYIVYLIINIMFVLSVISVLFSYIGIMISKYKQCLNQLNLNVPKEKVYKECRSTIFKSLLYIILYLIIFSGKIYSLAYEMITGFKRTILMDLIATCLIACSSFINAVILLYMNQEVRKSFIELVCKVKSKVLNRNND
ncbi:family A G protein-coupled receptor-like protein [Conidiobolus coronatus NRRL 28638]|uniref:Family A G protein-coupled receptor-like protein n=1 Tax=Conidiobolus coronatus (strain ATCC 28846 / CBS 209.66 / NRRL 28638) TaxID=796925 RepID=A0A137NU38_CONC2|nr:family A G protein-coupled receptor-like protein [Conidiobolus coronatus NRRL 28638]|eukprot:KXN66211.1 family A G protein-coupled receptor-like protein [Conidiobolus coronatus NRRL 28638]